MTEKTLLDETLGPVRLRKSPQARRISIRIHPLDGVVVTVPRWVPFSAGVAFLVSRRDWARAAIARQALRRQEAEAAVREELQRTAPADPPLQEKDAVAPPVAAPLTSGQLAEAVERWRKEAKAVLPPRLAELAARYGFTYNRVIIKHNRTNWGSCSTKGNINLNLALVRLPEPLRDYVLLHELAHLHIPNHGPAFHALLESLCRAELGSPARPLERALKKYLLF